MSMSDVTPAVTEDPSEDLLALDEALTRLEEQWPDKAKLVKLRYFAGLTIPEASHAIGVSTATAERYWRFARLAGSIPVAIPICV
jgi:DNA-directed RNA polymerase specialized sigma24 family protein